jgi:molecular chaperone DnaK
MANYFGIDFGTTNSAVHAITAIGDSVDDEFDIGENDRRPLPSYVAIHKGTGDVVTGLDAKGSIADENEYKVFSSIKTIIGEDREWKIAGKIWTPVDIATELFKALKKKAEASTKGEMTEAVVAVPVGFSSKKKNNVRKAAKAAGIKVLMFVSEPTSAYCSRASEMRRYHNVAVFDWGGGTLDVVVLRVEGNIIHELSAVGITMAGNDIDRHLAERICMNVASKSGDDFAFEDLSQKVQLRLLQKCEQAKCDLADEDIVTIMDANLDGYGMMMEKIDYPYFSLLIENEINQAVDCLMRALADAGMNKESIDCILCEGGSSRLRPLQEKLLKLFDRNKLIFPRKAMWDIATGVAQIAYKPGCYTLNRPMGLILSNNKFYPLLKAGQRVPTEEKVVTFGVIDGSKDARFVISDGEETNQTFSEIFPVKIRGFSDEVITVSCYVDADMVFRMKIKSNRMPDDFFRVWTYSNLKVSYEIDAPAPVINEK